MSKIAHREYGTLWNSCFSPSMGQYNKDNNNHKIKETNFQLVENDCSQGMTALHVEMNDQGLGQDWIYIAVDFILDGKKTSR